MAKVVARVHDLKILRTLKFLKFLKFLNPYISRNSRLYRFEFRAYNYLDREYFIYKF